MSEKVLEISNLGKQYKLGTVGTGTLSHDLNRWWARLRGKEDPYLKVGEENDCTSSKTEGYVWALKGVSFELNRGDVLGVIGRNGAGKSTLLKLLSRITSPSEGEIKIKGKIAALLEVGTGFHPELTGLENIYLNGSILGMTKKEINAKLDEIIEFSGCAAYINTPVKRYSSGMLVRLGFSVAAHLEPDILVVDEVLAVGDLEFQNKCIGKMSEVSKSGRTVIFVSHNMQAVGKLCTKGIYLKNGMLQSAGDINDVLEDYITSIGTDNFHYKNPKNTFEEGGIQEAFIVNKDSKPIGEIPVGEQWGIKIKFKLEKDLTHVIMAVGLSGALDENINSSWSSPFNLSAGTHELTFWNEDILYSAGTYYITLGLSTHERTIHYIPSKLSFMIIETGKEKIDNRIIRLKGNGFVLNQMTEKIIHD
jgi:ABC-type polysaccharide/polyol phosphate transport system ATPase subunit